jgi:E3 ubiquitin-protein ligase TRIP12
VVRVDPLATLQAVERYLLVKGVTKPDPIPITNEDMEGSDDSDSEEPLLPTIPTGPVKQQLEFLINDNVISHNMTVFQAVKQYGLASPSSDSEEELSPLGHPDIWIKSHMLHYRLVGQGQPSGLKPKRSYSLPATPFESTQPKRLSTSGNGGGTKSRRTKLSSLSKEGIRVTRSMSREQQHHHGDTQDNPVNFDTYTTPTTGLSPLLQDIKYYRDNPINVKDASAPIINLLRILWSLNNHWNDLYNGFPGNPIVAPSEFISNKLTAKATRQLQDPLNVMTGNFPDWLKGLSSQCPFLFPFECRQTLFFLITFDRDRGIARLQEQQPELSLLDASERITPKLEKKKRCVSRDNLLSQAEKIMEELSSSRALLEIQYEDEVGIGLGPTLEFYTLVSRELQKIDLHMWRGDPCPLPGSSSSYVSDSSGLNQYIYSSVGLYPAPIGASTDFSVVEEICARFRFLGRFMAKAIMDFRMLDLPLSEAFNKWILGQENSFTAQDLQHVDPIISQSFAQLADIAVKKRQLENDSLLTGTALQLGIQSLTLDGGGTIEGLELDFTLPGYPDIELKPNGRNVPVTIHNLDEYLKLMLDWTLITGVRRQMQAFQEGFNDVFSISTLQCFYSYEMDMFLCGANNQKWDIKELMEHCRPDHGYNHDSQAIQYLFQVLSSYSTAEQRQFIQFVTGSPRLPVGGFKALNPPLTIVRKTTDSSLSPDNFLPSVMTCVNYLKLPDYTSESVMREKLNIALKEGKQSFHLS